MFEKLRDSIDAAENMLADLDYNYRNASQYYKQYSDMEYRDEFDERQLQIYKARLDLYSDVKDFIEKWVKKQM